MSGRKTRSGASYDAPLLRFATKSFRVYKIYLCREEGFMVAFLYCVGV